MELSMTKQSNNTSKILTILGISMVVLAIITALTITLAYPTYCEKSVITNECSLDASFELTYILIFAAILPGLLGLTLAITGFITTTKEN